MKVVENRKIFFMISLCIIGLTIIFGIYNSVIGNGVFNYDVDFSGGTSLTYDIGQDADVADVEAIVAKAADFPSPRVQKILGGFEMTVKIPTITNDQRNVITADLKTAYPSSELLGYADVSATVSGEMRQKAIVAVILACIAMLIYITFRFKDILMGASAIAALVHDVIVLLAMYIIFRIPVNNSFIAAILTILGYSINATIVVFDRIRENRKFVKRHETELLIDSSINQTLTRSINTSITTLLAITCVYIYGVTSVREFALPIIVGIISGAYSSVFFAGSVWYSLLMKKAARKAV